MQRRSGSVVVLGKLESLVDGLSGERNPSPVVAAMGFAMLNPSYASQPSILPLAPTIDWFQRAGSVSSIDGGRIGSVSGYHASGDDPRPAPGSRLDRRRATRPIRRSVPTADTGSRDL